MLVNGRSKGMKCASTSNAPGNLPKNLIITIIFSWLKFAGAFVVGYSWHYDTVVTFALQSDEDGTSLSEKTMKWLAMV